MYNQKSSLLRSILIPVLIGTLSGLITMTNIGVYKTLIKPPLSPPGFIFPLVWTTLYILMGLSHYIISCSSSRYKNSATILYYTQLFVNFFWPILFFNFQFYWISVLWLALLIVLVLLMILNYNRINQVAAIIQLPYLLWCLFAFYLNVAIAFLNP